MAKAKKATTSTPASVSVRYDLLDLPTAQHKAGLAGLLLQVGSMEDRGLPAESIPQVMLVDPVTVEATFTEASLQGLFNDLYDAKKIRVPSSSKWSRAEPVKQKNELDPMTGRLKTVFVYEVVQPEGHFLRRFTEDDREVWHKLWRDMLWEIPRCKPKTREPFNKRAAGESSGVGEVMWKEVLAVEKAKQHGETRWCKVAGSIMLGVQEFNAERVSFRAPVDQVILLHFWPLVASIFVPEQLVPEDKSDGVKHTDKRHLALKSEFVGYVVAIPEIMDLSRFIQLYKRVLGQLSAKRQTYRPKSAVISLPAQGALEFMRSLASLAASKTSLDTNSVAGSLAKVEFFHFIVRDRRGRRLEDAKMVHRGNIAAMPSLLIGYSAILRSCRNPLFLSGRLLALLGGNSWYSKFGSIFADNPWPIFIDSNEAPRAIPSFAWDVRQRFESSLHNYKVRGQAMADGSFSPQQSLENIIYRLVRSYVYTKTEQKSGVAYASFKDRKVKNDKGHERIEYPQEYTEAQEKICSELFLGMRSRRDDEFVSYFTGTVGSVAQGTNLSNEADFHIVAEALLDENGRRDVRILAMLATAAASYTSSTSVDEEHQPEQEVSAE